jgi:hypothetical protein
MYNLTAVAFIQRRTCLLACDWSARVRGHPLLLHATPAHDVFHTRVTDIYRIVRIPFSILQNFKYLDQGKN